MAGHSLNSPSSFAKRRVCPASAMMEKDLPNDESVYAAEGTAAHTLGELCLKTGKEPSEYLGAKIGEFKHKNGKIEEFIVDGEMVDAVKIYVDYCRSIGKEFSVVEQKFRLPFIGEDEKGTSDNVTIDNRILHVNDYKHGQGVPVDAYQSIQGLCYGLGAAEKYKDKDWDKLRITIIQPRAWHRDGPIRSWDVPRGELLDWEMELAEAAELTRAPDPKMQPSEYCRWCKAAFHCMGIVRFIKEVTGMDIMSENGNTPLDIYAIPEAELAEILFTKLPIIEKWVHQVKDYAQSRAEQRNPLPGTKLVETRERRQWADEKAAEAFFGQVPGAYEKKFKTAPQMEKLLGKKEFDKHERQFVKKVSTGVTLVPSDDPRPSARPSGESEFTAVNLFD